MGYRRPRKLTDGRTMPYLWMEWAYFDDGHVARMGATAWLVLTSLAREANDDHQAMPGIAELAAKTGLSKQGVRNGLAALLKHGYIGKQESGGGKNHPAVYTIMPLVTAPQNPSGADCLPAQQTVHHVDPLDDQTVHAVDPKRSTACAKGSTACAPPHTPPIRNSELKRERSAPAAAPADDVRSFRDWWTRHWAEAHGGAYPWRPEEDRVVADLVQVAGGAALAAAAARRFFVDPDPFYSGHPLAKLLRDLPRWVGGPSARPAPLPPGEREARRRAAVEQAVRRLEQDDPPAFQRLLAAALAMLGPDQRARAQQRMSAGAHPLEIGPLAAAIVDHLVERNPT